MWTYPAKNLFLLSAIIASCFAFAAQPIFATGRIPDIGERDPETCTQARALFPDDIATAYRTFDPEGSWLGDLFITVGGTERKIADRAGKAWIINEGKEVAYSSNGGAGGYENEGQTLHIYTVKSRETREVLSHYYMIDEVKESKLGTGASALLVGMSDGGAGNPYFAVVDPKRGEVFFRRFAKLADVKGDTITLNIYRAGDWDAPYPPKDGTDPKPRSSKTISLNKILKNKVICNKPDHRSGRRTSC